MNDPVIPSDEGRALNPNSCYSESAGCCFNLDGGCGH